MKKNDCSATNMRRHLIVKYVLIMKLAVFLVFLTSFQAIALNTASQDRINLNLKDKSLISVIKSIESKYDYRFVYSDVVALNGLKVDVYAKDATIDYVMDKVLSNTSLSYKIMEKKLVIILNPEASANKPVRDTTIRVAGKIIDENNQPIQGVTISDVSGTRATISDEAGRYAIDAVLGDSIIFSHIGYQTLKVKPGVKEMLDVVMIGLTGTMNEIVVVGYGKQKRVTVTGSVATITTKDLQQSPVSNLTNALAGRLPGLITTQRSGEPGADASTIYIRGLATLNNATPIIVVDGVERSMDYIDANDIESLSILKDAAATAVFGMRGANGVVMITTKRGRRGAPQMNFRTSFGQQQPTKIPEFLGSYDYARLRNEALINDGQEPSFTPAQLEGYKNGTLPNTDYYGFLIKPSRVGQANLNISGGTNIVRYFVSAGVNIQEGNFKNTKDKNDGYNANNIMKRFNLRANVDVDITPTLTTSLSLAGIQTNKNGPNTNADASIGLANRMPPIYPIFNPDSSLFGTGTYRWNLYGEIAKRGYKVTMENTIQGTLSFTKKLDVITKNLSAKFSYSYDNIAKPEIIYDRNYAVGYPVYGTGGKIVEYKRIGEDTKIDPNGTRGGGDIDRISYTEATLNWFRSYNLHNVSAMGLWNRRQRRWGSLIPFASQAYLFRGTYNYDSRYLFEFNGSYMGSENFPKESRYGFFPSVSAGWVISQEKFIKNNDAFDFITMLKFRGSYGEVGNDRVGDEKKPWELQRFLWFTSWTGGNNYWFGTGYPPSQANGLAQGDIGNMGVTWERGRQLNLALEGNILKDIFSFTIELYKQRRNNILLRRNTLSDVFGQGVKPQNIGIVDSKGIDIELGHKNMVGLLTYFVKGNFTYAKNKVVFMDEVGRAYPWMVQTGLPIGTKFGLVADGFFQNLDEVHSSPAQFGVVRPGDIRYVKLTGTEFSSIQAGYDERPIGYARTPEIMYGFSTGLAYKGFDASILFQGAAHSSVMLNNEAVYEFFQEGKVKPMHLNRWTPETSATATYPLLHMNTNANNHRGSSFWIRSADYLRIKNVELGYQLPSKWLRPLKITSTRFFVNGMNVFTFKNALNNYYVDPEIDDGFGAMYPIQKIWSAGIDINF